MITDISKEEFSRKIEKYRIETNSSDIDGVIYTFEEYSYDLTLATKLLTQPLIEKLESEGQELNLLPKSKNRLPFS
jgi:hypothetical protein